MDCIPLGKEMKNDTRSFIKHISLGLGIMLLIIIAINGLGYTFARDTEELDLKTNYITVMKASDAESVLAIINAEGFDQAFNHYSTYRDINDTKFHDLRKAYIAASKELRDYIEESAGKVSNVPFYLSYEGRN